VDLDLSPLTDDQLVELARSVAVEISTRSPAVTVAAQSAVEEIVRRAAASQDSEWSRKKWLATMVYEAIGDHKNATISVWSPAGSDTVRVYIDVPASTHKNNDFIKYCYHATGDAKNPPKALTVSTGSRISESADHELLKIVCAHAVVLGANISISRALATDYAIPPLPADFLARVAKIEAADRAKKLRAAANKKSASETTDPAREAVEAAVASVEAREGRRRWVLGSAIVDADPRVMQAKKALDAAFGEHYARMKKYDEEHAND
jgi:hypothetical protein